MTANELEQGKAYDCRRDGDNSLEKTTIIPVALDPQTNQRFVIIGARELLRSNPFFLRSLLRMSFCEIVNEDLEGGPHREWSSHVWKFSIGEHGSLYYEDFDCYLEDFAPTTLPDITKSED